MQHSLVAAGGAILFLCCCLHTEQVTGCHVGAGRTPESCCHFNISTLIICKQMSVCFLLKLLFFFPSEFDSVRLFDFFVIDDNIDSLSHEIQSWVTI